MNARDKFLEMFDSMPKKARQELVYDFLDQPMTLNVVAMEVRYRTGKGNEILRKLGFEDEVNHG